MRARLMAAFLLLSLALTAAQGYVVYRVEQLHLGDLFLIEPAIAGSGGVDQKAVEELTKQGLIMTYALPRQAAPFCLNASYPATVIGTNASYVDVTGYPVLSGGFLTETAMRDKNLHAVLNETAAYRMFGTDDIVGNTIKLDGDIWSIVGLIRDSDKANSNIYIPAPLTQGSPNAFLVRMGGDHTEAYVRAKLGELGIHETSYHTANLADVAGAFMERLGVSLLAAAICLLIVATKRLVGAVGNSLRALRSGCDVTCTGEPLVGQWGSLARLAGLLLLLLAAVSTVLLLSLRILEPCLGWREVLAALRELSGNNFADWVGAARKWQTASLAIFFTTLCLHVCLFICLFTCRKT